MVKKMIDVLVAVLVGVSILPTLISGWTGVALDNITIGAKSYDLAWAGYLGILFFVLGIAFFGYKMISTK